MFGAVEQTGSQAVIVRTTQIGYVLSGVLQALAGMAVMVWANTIVEWFEADTNPLNINLSRTEFQVLGFALVGVVVLVDGLRDASAAAYVLLNKPEFDEYGTLSYVWAREGEVMIKAVVQVVAGALLMFGRETLADGWSRLRARPIHTAERDTEDADEQD
jgi:hypothetical protein